MAKKSAIEKNNRRKRLVAKYAAKRAELLAIANNRELPIDNVDEGAAELIELEAGQLSLHDIGLIHASAANTSGRRRAGLALRYMPATSCMYRVMPNAAAGWEDMPMELVAGENRNPGNDFSLGEFGRPWA